MEEGYNCGMIRVELTKTGTLDTLMCHELIHEEVSFLSRVVVTDIPSHAGRHTRMFLCARAGVANALQKGPRLHVAVQGLGLPDRKAYLRPPLRRRHGGAHVEGVGGAEQDEQRPRSSGAGRAGPPRRVLVVRAAVRRRRRRRAGLAAFVGSRERRRDVSSTLAESSSVHATWVF